MIQRRATWPLVLPCASSDLAAALNLTPEALRRVEAGRQHLDSAGIEAATRALRLPVWALVSDAPAY